MSDLILNKGVTLVDFWAPWCGPCRSMAPVLEKLETELKDFKLVKINVDEPDPQEYTLLMKHNVRSIPCFVVYKDNKEVQTVTGVQSYSSLKKMIEDALKG